MASHPFLWSTSESHYHAEVARLARFGLLTSFREPGKTRTRTRYVLTVRGQATLADWLVRPSEPPRMQHDVAGRLLAGAVDTDGLRTSLDPLRATIARAQARSDAAPAPEPVGERLARSLERALLAAYAGWLEESVAELAHPPR